MNAIQLTGHLICASEEEAAIVAAYLPLHVEQTRAETGCLQFDVAPTHDPLVWSVFELFTNQEAFDSHQDRVRASEWGVATSTIKRDYLVEVVDR